jgi:predicted Fe-S protein YdhL (DUF1289 family)
MNPYLQDILHNITTRLAKLEEAQPKKEWVGLTDEDRKAIFDLCDREDRGYVAAMVEAKLKEKNER